MIRLRGSKYHYQFDKNGKTYSGVCEGCTTKREAEAYEKRMKGIVEKAVEQRDVKQLVETFRDELINLGAADFTVNSGDRIAQIVIAPVTQAAFTITDSLSETERGSGGFGSTGVSGK